MVDDQPSPQPLAVAEEEPAHVDAASIHSQHDKAKDEVMTEETYCELPAPQSHQMREYDRIFRLVVFGNGVQAGFAGRRGCVRTEVENKKEIAVEFTFFRLFALSLNRAIANQFQVGQHESSTSIRFMLWRFTFGIGVDLAVWAEDGKKYTSTATKIDVETRLSTDGLGAVYVMNWVSAKDGKTGSRSTRKSVQVQFPMLALPIMDNQTHWTEESREIADGRVGRTDTEPPPSSFSQLTKGLKEMIRLIRQPVTPNARGVLGPETNVQNLGANATVVGREAGQGLLELSSNAENEAPSTTTEADIEAQRMQASQSKAVPKGKIEQQQEKTKSLAIMIRASRGQSGNPC